MPGFNLQEKNKDSILLARRHRFSVLSPLPGSLKYYVKCVKLDVINKTGSITIYITSGMLKALEVFTEPCTLAINFEDGDNEVIESISYLIKPVSSKMVFDYSNTSIATCTILFKIIR